MFDIHYKGFVITYFTSWLAKQIISILYVKFVRLSHDVILVYIRGLSYRQEILLPNVTISSSLVWLLGD